MQAKEIYDILRAGGLSRAGALGMLGNMMAESSLRPNIAQRGMTKLSDEAYTKAANDGAINFVDDGVGYGLCQWTFYTRKRELLDYAKSYDVSVGDGQMQVEFCLLELREFYPNVFHQLCDSTSIDGCSDVVCTQYERPAVLNLEARRRFAHQFEKEIPEQTYTPPIKEPVSATFPPDPTVLAFQLWLCYNGYTVECNGYKSKGFFDTLDQFVADMKKC